MGFHDNRDRNGTVKPTRVTEACDGKLSPCKSRMSQKNSGHKTDTQNVLASQLSLRLFDTCVLFKLTIHFVHAHMQQQLCLPSLQGNLILADHNYEVLTLLRSHRDDAKGFAIMARHPYPIHTIRLRQPLSGTQLASALESTDEKQTLRGTRSGLCGAYQA